MRFDGASSHNGVSRSTCCRTELLVGFFMKISRGVALCRSPTLNCSMQLQIFLDIVSKDDGHITYVYGPQSSEGVVLMQYQ